MAFAYNVQRVTISGTCFGGAEIWSTGFYLGNETADAGTASQAQVDAIAARWQTFFTASTANISNAYQTTQVKVAEMLADGKTDPLNVVYHTYGTPISGNQVAGPMPAQISLAATLTSAFPRGRAAKGRMFLPGVNISVSGSNGKLLSGSIPGLVTALRTFLNGVNTDGSPSAQLILAAKATTKAPIQPGLNKLVTGVNIGDVYDTQRRRRNGLKESRTAATIP